MPRRPLSQRSSRSPLALVDRQTHNLNGRLAAIQEHTRTSSPLTECLTLSTAFKRTAPARSAVDSPLRMRFPTVILGLPPPAPCITKWAPGPPEPMLVPIWLKKAPCALLTAAGRRRLTPDPHKHPSRGAHSPLRDLVPPIRLT